MKQPLTMMRCLLLGHVALLMPLLAAAQNMVPMGGGPMLSPGGGMGEMLMPGQPGMMPGMGNTEPVGQADVGTDDTIRDPFWPIGWAPATGETNEVDATSETSAPVEVVPTINWPELVMKGNVLAPDGSYWARLDKVGWVKTGDTIAMKRDGYIFKWKINKVTDEAISVKKLEASPVQ